MRANAEYQNYIYLVEKLRIGVLLQRWKQMMDQRWQKREQQQLKIDN